MAFIKKDTKCMRSKVEYFEGDKCLDSFEQATYI